MKVRAYKIFSNNELTQIQSRLGDIVRQWTKSWVSEEYVPVVTVTAFEHAHAMHDSHQDYKWCMTTTSERQWVAVMLGDDGIHGLENFLSGRLNGSNGFYHQSSVLAGKLARKLMHDLADSVIKQAPCNLGKNVRSHADSTDSLSQETWARGSGAIYVEISLRGMTIVLIISAELTSGYLPSAGTVSKSSTPLTPIKKAIGPVKIDLEVDIGSAMLTLGELRNMVAGDVIRLDAKLAQPVQVLLNKRITCAGFLGAHRGNKAVLLKSLTS